jgi:hypothetical protein
MPTTVYWARLYNPISPANLSPPGICCPVSVQLALVRVAGSAELLQISPYNRVRQDILANVLISVESATVPNNTPSSLGSDSSEGDVT